jgi:DNA-binding CsgD family transcriptional regulator
MPRWETQKLNDPRTFATIAGRISLESEIERRDLVAQENPVFAGQDKDRIITMADTLIVITNQGLLAEEKKTSLPLSYMIGELIYLSKGYSQEQRAAIQDLEPSTVKKRIRRIKVEMGTRTRPQAVAEGIRLGYIPIQVETEPSFDRLSWMEERVLSYSAAGWSSIEIAEHYNISPNTVDRYYEQIRKKLGSHNMPHAVRRAFEVGIFKQGESINEAAELDSEMIVSLPAAKNETEPLVIKDYRQIALLRIMAEQQTGWISTDEALKTGFYANTSDVVRSFQFGRMMLSLSAQLEAAAGRPIVGRKKIRIAGKRTNIYFFNEGLVVGLNAQQQTIPAYPEANIGHKPVLTRKVAPKPKPKMPKVTLASKPIAQAPTEQNLADLTPANSSLAAEIEQEQPVSDFLEPSEVPALDDTFLESLVPRNLEDVLLDPRLKEALRQISSRQLAKDYRTRLLLALRFGVPSATLGLKAIQRLDQSVQIRAIEGYILPYRGLDLKSASQVSSLTPLALLTAERQMIEEFGEKFPVMKTLAAKIESQTKALKSAVKTGAKS